MASLSTLDFTAIVRNTVTAVQSLVSALINLTIGSVLRAIMEANAAVILWLQGLITYVLTLTRFATSKGSDADSWGADFTYPRLPAKAATGSVTFSRFTNTAQAVVPFNTPLQTTDGTQSFFVTVDSTNAAYNATLGGYVIAASVSSVTVPVQAVNAGTGGNVLANSITSIGQGISGVDLVTNASAFENGIDAETDAAYYARFPLYLASLSKATDAAIRSAVASVQQGLQLTVTANYDYNGTYDPGFFYVVVDDGSGTPSDILLGSVGTAINAVVALGIRFAVFAPIVVTANVGMTITSAAGLDHATVVGAVGVALQNFINTLPLGVGLPYTQVASIAYGVAGVTNVSAVLLNSGTSDLAATAKEVIKAGTVSVA
jgi:uncharacterized phage protein gp47/JayE